MNRPAWLQECRTGATRTLSRAAFPCPSRAIGRPSGVLFTVLRALVAASRGGGGELPAMEGGDFHPYRRAWATARKDLPIKDVAHAGGWRDLRSLDNCYQQVDPSTLLALVTHPAKVRELKEPKSS